MSDEAPIRLLLVDDHPVVREGLRRIQELWPTLRIVAEVCRRPIKGWALGTLETPIRTGNGLEGYPDVDSLPT